jgi:PAS domain S-box-containing protein
LSSGSTSSPRTENPRRHDGADVSIRASSLTVFPEGSGLTPSTLNRILDHTTQPFVIATLDGSFLKVNRAYEELVGYKAAELAGMTVREVTSGDCWDASAEIYLKVADSGESRRYEKIYRRKDGREIPVEVSLDLWRDDQGEPRGLYAFVTDISERKRAEAALKASEDRFRSLFDDAPFGYHELDLDGTIRTVNRTEAEMLGHSRESMIGRPIFDFIAPSSREKSRAAIREWLQGEKAVRLVERNFQTSDGRERIMAVESRVIRDHSGTIVGLRSTLQDITQRKQTEAALVASERRSRALFEGIDDVVFVHDRDGRILDANTAACRRLGYTREEFLALNTSDIDDPDFASGYEDRVQTQFREGRLQCEGRHRAKDGRIIPVDINTSTIQLEDKPAVLAVIRDITERKALEETRKEFAESQLRSAKELEAKNRELVQSEARYRQLTEGCLDAIVVTDQEGKIVLFNVAAERTFGYEAAEVIGTPFINLMPEDLRDDLITGLQNYLHAHDDCLVGHTLEMKGHRKDGTSFPLEISLSAVEIAGELQFLGAIRDLTERQRLRAMLMQSERLASIGLLSAGVAHEINNPLAFVANNLAVLERDLEGVLAMMATYDQIRPVLEQAAPELLAKIQEQSDDLDWPYVRANLGRMITRTREGVQRVANIVQNLRGLARTGPPKLEPANLSDLVAGAVDIVQNQIRKAEITLVVGRAASAKIACVPAQIGQVLINLLVNAIQAVEIADRPPGARRIDVAIRQERDSQVVEIADSGCGIPPEALGHLFDPFFTTKPVGEGTGLGLSISHGIVTGHGGSIEVESEPGVGSRFRVILPWKSLSSTS